VAHTAVRRVEEPRVGEHAHTSDLQQMGAVPHVQRSGVESMLSQRSQRVVSLYRPLSWQRIAVIKPARERQEFQAACGYGRGASQKRPS
jgi:hypothetical protein